MTGVSGARPRAWAAKGDVADLTPEMWLVLLDPEKFGEREPGECRVADTGDEGGRAAGEGSDAVALGTGALVVPEERSAEDGGGAAGGGRIAAQEHAAVHLAAESDRADGDPWVLGDECADCLNDGEPPILRVLLGPTGMGLVERIVAGGGTEDGAAVVAQDGLGGGCADVDAEQECHGAR